MSECSLVISWPKSGINSWNWSLVEKKCGISITNSDEDLAIEGLVNVIPPPAEPKFNINFLLAVWSKDHYRWIEIDLDHGYKCSINSEADIVWLTGGAVWMVFSVFTGTIFLTFIHIYSRSRKFREPRTCLRRATTVDFIAWLAGSPDWHRSN